MGGEINDLGGERNKRFGIIGIRAVLVQYWFIVSFLYLKYFRSSIVGKEVLPPPDLERIFGLTGGRYLLLQEVGIFFYRR